ncbi:DUF1573 domain-containing protein [Kiritimatiella glycovorans]|uniref:DUF1573 domain-containing protein n=1 Tax=Kiritimatiella glycovorans TaxID=1307763 RepID=A0A0G3EEJ9_9BACT|nr:DUF1573 domain-containing protein [Kiritimatiella glycovorans]AKJ64886.1 hypothetical protein L21SP4_01643 [Kiritimatiella glycovorans]
MKTGRTWIVLALTALIGAGAVAAPDLVCENPHWRFDYASDAEVLTHSFVLRNTGDQTLVIKEVQADCGCTRARVGSREIPPEGSTDLEVRFNPSGRSGEQHKQVTVISNDPEQPRFEVTIEGFVQPPIWVNPEQLWLPLSDGDEVARRITLEFDRDTAVGEASTSVGFLDLNVLELKRSRIYVVEVTAAPPYPEGRIDGAIRIDVDHPDRSRIVIPVKGYVQ